MKKRELSESEIDFKMDALTLNRQFEYWLVKSKCIWSLRLTNKKYNSLREEGYCHSDSLEFLKRKMFVEGIN